MRRFFAAALLLTLAGCLPSSCQREGPQALFPADSLSRQVAEAVPVDTLRLVWRARGSEAERLAFPRTVQFGPGGGVQASDVERGRIFVFGEDGAFRRTFAREGLETPYLAGRRGDTTLVFDPAGLRMDFFVGGRLARFAELQIERPDEEPLLWATGSEDALFAKATGREAGAAVMRLDGQGAVVAQQALPGPAWRHAGRLHLWQGKLLSLSGFRPVVDLLPLDLAAPPDTLALVGFDSPMLARSRAFALGETQQPPLLSEAAAPLGEQLFALNLRPGWLRIDVFGPDGRLQHRLTQPAPSVNQNFYPRDLAVRRRPDGSYEIAVVLSAPEPVVELYRWQPSASRAGGPQTADGL